MGTGIIVLFLVIVIGFGGAIAGLMAFIKSNRRSTVAYEPDESDFDPQTDTYEWQRQQQAAQTMHSEPNHPSVSSGHHESTGGVDHAFDINAASDQSLLSSGLDFNQSAADSSSSWSDSGSSWSDSSSSSSDSGSSDSGSSSSD